MACGVGALIIFSLLSCCWSRCRRARTPPKNLQHYNLPPNRGPGSQQQNWNNTPPYMRAPQQAGPMGQHRSFRGHGTRGSETAVGSAGYNPYTQNDSVRYA